MHLTIDGYGNKQIMQDEQFIYQLLDSYPSKIGMTKIQGPIVFRYVGAKPEDWGISGLVFIAESHISLHTFVDRNYINIDIFSCRDFNVEQVVRDFVKQFHLTKYTSRLINREWNVNDLTECTEMPRLHSI